MVYDYVGHHRYNAISVSVSAPEVTGVYYCGHLNLRSELIPLYIGKSINIRERLQSHLNNERWSDVSHFGYRKCSTQKEAEDLEAVEIRRHNPRYNEQGKKVFRYTR